MTSLSHLFVHVADLGRTKSFYVDVLGLEVLLEHPGYLRVGGGDGFHIGFEEREPDLVGAAGIELVVRVDDVDAAVAALRARGLQAGDPADQEWGARHSWLRDPDGYRLSVFSPLA